MMHVQGLLAVGLLGILWYRIFCFTPCRFQTTVQASSTHALLSEVEGCTGDARP